MEELLVVIKKMKYNKIMLGILAIILIGTLGTLTIANTTATTINEKAIRDLGNGDSEFYFAVIDSVENRYSSYWQNNGYNFHKVRDEINQHPEIKFIVSTGDGVVNPVDYEDAINQFKGLFRYMNTNFNVPTIYVAGNHDIGSYGRYEVMKVWELFFGDLEFEWEYGGVHFIASGNGNMQFSDIQIADPMRYEKVCDMASENMIFFKHMHTTGASANGITNYPYAHYPCTYQFEHTEFFGHYNQNQDYTRGNVRFIQTSDASHGNWRLVHVKDGEIIGTKVY